MQKDIINQGHRHYQNNHTILYPSQQQPNQMIFAQNIGAPGGQQQQVIRPTNPGYFVQQQYIQSQYQNAPTEVFPSYQAQPTYVPTNAGQFYPTTYQPQQYIVSTVPPPTAGYPRMPPQPRISTPGPPQLQQTRQINYNTQVGVGTPQTPMYVNNQAEVATHPTTQTHKKSSRIKIVDPNTGEDKTEAFAKKPEKQPPSNSSVQLTTQQPVENTKAAVNAQFQKQVLAVAAKSATPKPNETALPVSKPPVVTEPVKTNKSKETSKVEKSHADVEVSQPTPEIKKSHTTEMQNVNEKHGDVEVNSNEKTNSNIPRETHEENLHDKDHLNDSTDQDVKSVSTISQPAETEAVIEPEIVVSKETVTETQPEEKQNIESQETTVDSQPDTSKSVEENITINDKLDTEESVEETLQKKPIGVEEIDEPVKEADKTSLPAEDTAASAMQEDTNKSAFNTVTKKKKAKHRFKDKDNGSNNDMLSAFKDKPEKKEEEVIQTSKPIEKPAEDVLSEDATWEEKEKSIEKEVIRNEDVEETEVIPKTAETRIIKSESTPVPTEEDKLQYDRDFLLKFQFAPICKTKPAGLPDIDIVLDHAHAPTEALIPGQRISSSNDFMPTFMRSQSGGGSRSSGGGRSRDGGNRRITSSSLSSKPQKVIAAPQFENIELKKSENAWVRPSEKARDLSETDRELDELLRNVRSILNKLTPQKFDTLLSQMKALNIDSPKKLQDSIDLVFEKAVSEPNFSVAYAKMCRELSTTAHLKNVPGENTDAAQNTSLSFRKVLLNKCQKEFEKETIDEKEISEARNKTFDSEEKRREWLEEVDYKERMNRRRMLGNIRFIGELFKLRMISETIIHNQCIVKLLRSDKQETLEDQLECLCKLLATVGKDLDHVKGKPRMDQYFNQIQKIIAKKKISSRIKFALQDVIELRMNKWVPRRDEGNPKTIDQIHEEAQKKEREQERENIQRQQEKMMRKDTRRGGGGRESPSIRGGGGDMATVSADGWTNVGSKSTRQISAAPVDPTKFKLKKNEGEISLGPTRPGLWSRGASGGSNRSGSNTPTSEVEQRANRYDILTDSSVSHSTFDNKGRMSGGRQSNSRRGTPPFGTGSRKVDERTAALRAVKDMTGGRSSRNQSPARESSDSPRNTPPSGSQTPVSLESSTPPIQDEISEDAMTKKTKSTIEEFFGCEDKSEASLCLKELNSPSMHYVFVREAISLVIEKKPEHRRMVGMLLQYLINENTLTLDQYTKGLSEIIEFAGDIAVDVPLIYKYLGEVLAPIVYNGTLPLNKLKDILQPLVPMNKAAVVMAETLTLAITYAGNKESIVELWHTSRMTWNSLVKEGTNAPDIVKKMDFLSTRTAPPPANHASEVQKELNKLLKERTEKVTSNVISFIEDKVPSDRHTKLEFIHMLTRLVCSSAVVEEKDGCRCDRKLLSSRKNILERFINSNKELELQALYAVQQVVSDLHHPKDLLKNLFEELYECEVVTEDTFYSWEESKDYPEGKGMALTSVKGFLNWLRKAEEESNEEETVSSSVQTNLAQT